MTRTRADDACPGALQVHQAADGALVRVRLPGGMITAAQLQVLAKLAAGHGSGSLELTSRGSLQLRGIGDPGPVADAIAAAGLLPSPTHERVRNIVSSPLSGRAGGLIDVRDRVGELDARIRQDPVLAGLPGRFWFSIDDGRADVSGLRADVGVQAVHGDAVAVLLAGVDTGVRLPEAQAVPTLIRIAERFQQIRGKSWRITELDDTAPLLDGFTPTVPPGDTFPATLLPPVGWIPQHDGRVTLGAAVPLGVLPARTAEFLAAIEAPLVITPWRSVLVCDLQEETAEVSVRVLAPLGLVFDENSPWLSVTACTGSPGCERSRADVRADATAAVESGQTPPHRRHYVGCERACGSPIGGEVVVATPDGYQPLERHP
ncbi:MAG: precorrin-3B synthase [Mycobacterium sp.]|nr:precorrin-3B synthase [Mycobacterium sp.]